jgi:D-alanine-D-alanine ligase-like ATP-grasp enzyme
MKIAVVYNEPVSGKGDSVDVLDEISLVTDSLKKLGHDFKVFPVGDRRGTCSLSESAFSLLISLRKYAPDIIFNLIEEFKGESSHQPYFLLMFELANYSFTGSHYEAVLTTNDKGLSKMIMKKFQISTTPYQGNTGGKK